MVNPRKIPFEVPAVALALACLWLLWQESFWVSSKSTPTRISKVVPQQAKSTSTPCWYTDIEAIRKSPELSAAFNKRTEREIYGYPTDITLREAVRIFNEEEECIRFRGTLPPLTEDEMIAAIVGGPTYGTEEIWVTQRPRCGRSL